MIILSEIEKLLTPEQKKLVIKVSGTIEYTHVKARIYKNKVELLGFINNNESI